MRVALTVVGGLVAVWAAFVLLLFVRRPERATLALATRLVPDTVRLVGRLARDRTISLTTRLPVWLLLAYLVVPIDLVPDFLPVVGYADDVILVSLVLRRLVRRAGADKLVEHWPGTEEGLDTLQRALRLGVSDST